MLNHTESVSRLFDPEDILAVNTYLSQKQVSKEDRSEKTDMNLVVPDTSRFRPLVAGKGIKINPLFGDVGHVSQVTGNVAPISRSTESFDYFSFRYRYSAFEYPKDTFGFGEIRDEATFNLMFSEDYSDCLNLRNGPVNFAKNKVLFFSELIGGCSGFLDESHLQKVELKSDGTVDVIINRGVQPYKIKKERRICGSELYTMIHALVVPKDAKLNLKFVSGENLDGDPSSEKIERIKSYTPFLKSPFMPADYMTRRRDKEHLFDMMELNPVRAVETPSADNGLEFRLHVARREDAEFVQRYWPVSVDGYPVQIMVSDRQDPENKNQQRRREMDLKEDFETQGYCFAKWTRLKYYRDSYRENAVFEGVLARQKDFEGFSLASGSKLHLHPDGSLMSGFLAKPATFQGIPLAAQTEIYLFPNAALKRGVLADSFKINGIIFSGGHELELYETGLPKSGILADFYTDPLSGLRYVSGTHLQLAEDGHVIRGTIANDVDLDHVLYPAGSEFCFNKEDGRLISVKLSRDTKINGLLMSRERVVTFSGDGKLNSGKLVEGGVFQGKKLPENSEFYYDCEHQENVIILGSSSVLDSWPELPQNTIIRLLSYGSEGPTAKVYLPENWVVPPFVFKKGNVVEANWATGQIFSGVLAEEASVSGFVLAANHGIELHDGGGLKGAVLARNYTVSDKWNIPPGSRIELNKSKKFVGLLLKEDGLVAGEYWSSGCQFIFHDNEKPAFVQMERVYRSLNKMVFLNESIGVIMRKGKLSTFVGVHLWMHESGGLKLGVLAEDTTIEGRVYPRFTRVEFNKSGKLIRYWLPKEIQQRTP